MKFFHCGKCRQIIYFENIRCLNCQSELGFLEDLQDMAALRPVREHAWECLTAKGEKKIYKKCGNYERANVCNWLLPVEKENSFCLACDLNIVIPNLSKEGNHSYWYRLESAKRRLVYTLIHLNLSIPNRKIDPDFGLGFKFLENEEVPFQETRKIMTGHVDGVITINLKEADDAYREKMRLDMRERYRTILGHFRHESGHFYWIHLIKKSGSLTQFRDLFGNEEIHYDSSLKRFYKDGPKDNWVHNFVSPYASSHPWEDWAETWAHYLHMSDTLETAKAWGLQVEKIPLPATEGGVPDKGDRESAFQSLFREWEWMSLALNSMNRSMGLKDFYPFTLSARVKEKLEFVDRVIRENQAKTE